MNPLIYVFLIFIAEALWSYIIGAEMVTTVIKKSIAAPCFAMGGTFLGYIIIKYLDQEQFNWILIIVATLGVGLGTLGVARRFPKWLWKWLRPRSKRRQPTPFSTA
jgi:F0F1-type ATP synthase assembly protein I